MRELAGVHVRPPSSIFERLWRLGGNFQQWEKAKITPVFKKKRKDDLGNFRPDTLTLLPETMMASMLLDPIPSYMIEKVIVTVSIIDQG